MSLAKMKESGGDNAIVMKLKKTPSLLSVRFSQLEESDRKLLGRRGIVRVPKDQYKATPNPPK